MKGKMGTELWLLFGISLVWMLGTSHGNLVMDALAAFVANLKFVTFFVLAALDTTT